MIIHILGKAGSGKTTLGKKLSKLPNTFVIDTDDIDDPNSLKLLKKYDFETQKNIDEYFDELAKLDQKALDNYDNTINKLINEENTLIKIIYNYKTVNNKCISDVYKKCAKHLEDIAVKISY